MRPGRRDAVGLLADIGRESQDNNRRPVLNMAAWIECSYARPDIEEIVHREAFGFEKEWFCHSSMFPARSGIVASVVILNAAYVFAEACLERAFHGHRQEVVVSQ
jgi:hypothetical protein